MSFTQQRPAHAAPSRGRPAPRVTFVGVLGELMITAGVILGLFVVWQLWWTSVEADAAAATQLEEYYEQDLMTPVVREAAELNTTDPPPVPEPVGYGEMMGVLIVPTWYGKTNNTMPILEGTGLDVLDGANAGHYTETAQVGDVGNFSLAGHRRTHGNSFLYVPDLVEGDQVIVETADTWYVYEVTTHEVVAPSQVDVVAPVPGDPTAEPVDRLLTLTTCDDPVLGAYGNSTRWITHAEFVGWMDRADGMPEQIVDDPGVL
ncbi:class E sortase [Paraoerskovia marina]|uniref:class E sortase n=1 Tax=Paraoerskovia marina TaxID=545619 RepID=UPI0004929210|nr:class E sortase [Paraoerskovia marina]